MLAELNFHRNLLDIDAGSVLSRIKNAIRPFGELGVNIKSVTVMSRWLVVLIDITKIPEITVESCCDAVAGIIVCELQDYAVRYRHFTVLGEGPSLIFKDKELVS